MNSSLQRTYLFSDTFGSHGDYTQRPDADSIVCTNFRSFPLEKTQERFDIYGEPLMTAHMLRLILEEHDRIEGSEYLPKQIQEDFRKTITGVFINTAERTKEKNNGEPFYVATARNGSVRIVSTPLQPLSAIRNEIETLEVLPNENNGLYHNKEQFRSSYTSYLLYPDHTIPTEKLNPACIPEPRSDLHVSYVDRFGNIITHVEEPHKSEMYELLTGVDDIDLCIGNARHHARKALSLGEAVPGELSVYLNGNIDVVRKWQEGESGEARLNSSAYATFQKPKIGATVDLLVS